ncbi:hypothetical protein GGF32_010078 [Allomyces javanicus]|nr:hypothetical protein GGF32_010078 [Allomyces javanicus]
MRAPRSRSRTTFLALLLLALLAVTASVHAAPSAAKSWTVEIKTAEDLAKIKQAIAEVYGTQGMQLASIESEDNDIVIGDTFRALTLPAGSEELKAKILALAGVEAVEPEVEWTTMGTQQNPPFGLDRIDARQGTDRQFHFPDNAGQGVDVFVIDSGIDVKHPEFEGRATMTDLTGEGNFDSNSHGSHCAGTIGSKTFGVAKKARLVGLKVFDKSGRGSNQVILKAMSLAAQQAAKSGRKCVVSMSLGGPKAGADQATQRAVAALNQSGCAVVVAAGNEAQDACNVSPAFVPNAITVGASDQQDTLANFSNFGRCVDIIAPGVQVQSVAANTNGGASFKSGTSMATPHVAGVMAALLSQGMSLQQATQALLSSATPNVIRNVRGSPNKFLFLNGNANANNPRAEQPPVESPPVGNPTQGNPTQGGGSKNGGKKQRDPAATATATNPTAEPTATAAPTPAPTNPPKKGGNRGGNNKKSMKMSLTGMPAGVNMVIEVPQNANVTLVKATGITSVDEE